MSSSTGTNSKVRYSRCAMTTPVTDPSESVSSPYPRQPYHRCYGDFLARGLRCLPSSHHVDQDCAICLLPYSPSQPPVCLDLCGHIYHRECILTWLDTHSTCPMCRTNLFQRTKWRATYCLRTVTEGGAHLYDSQELDRLVESSLRDSTSATWENLKQRVVYRLWAEYDDHGRRLRYGKVVRLYSIVRIYKRETFGNDDPSEDHAILELSLQTESTNLR